MNKFTRYEAVALSDIHLGTLNCNYKKFDYFLKNIKTDKLFLVGDIVDFSHGNLGKFPVQMYIDKLKKMSERMEIVWICGNHEINIKNIEILTRGSNIKVYEDYYIDNETYTVLTHGHLYSNFSSKSWKNKANKTIYNLIRPINHILKKWLKFDLIDYLRNTPSAKNYISRFQESQIQKLEEIKKDKCVHTIGTGHIHFAIAFEDNLRNVVYFNCGYWGDNPTFAGHNRDGWEINYV